MYVSFYFKSDRVGFDFLNLNLTLSVVIKMFLPRQNWCSTNHRYSIQFQRLSFALISSSLLRSSSTHKGKVHATIMYVNRGQTLR